MAGDWMKIELELPDKPEVHYIAGALGLDPAAVVGHLIKVWGWFNKHTENGNAYGVTHLLLDRITGVTDFGQTMVLAGWLEQRDKTLHMPKFDRHTSESSKKRALSAERQSRFRNAGHNANVTHLALPREEKRSTPLPPCEGFETFWSVYPRKVAKATAVKAWQKLNPSADLIASILAGVRRDAATDQWQREGGRFVPHAATWLNGRRWEDEATVTLERRLAI